MEAYNNGMKHGRKMSIGRVAARRLARFAWGGDEPGIGLKQQCAKKIEEKA